MRKVILLIALVTLFFLPLFCSSKFISNFGDIYRYYYPHKFLAKECLIKGVIPLWNPYIFSGCPFLAQVQTSIFYPLNLIFYFSSLNLGFKLFYFLHFILLAAFVYFFLSAITCDTAASFYGSLIFTFSGYMVSFIPRGHSVMFSSYVWAIIVFFFAYRLLHSPSFRSEKNLIDYLFFIFSISILFLSGHTQVFYISVMFLFLSYLFLSKFSRLMWFIPSILVGLALGALQLLPTVEFTILSHRASQWDWSIATSYSAKVESLLTLALPNIYGNPFDNTYKDKGSVFFETMCFNIGFLPLIFAFIGIYSSIREKKYFWIFTSIVFFLLSLGDNLPGYKIVYPLIPGMKLFRAPARFLFITLFSFTVLSSIGWGFVFKNLMLNRLRGYLLTAAKLLVVLITFCTLYFWDRKFISLVDENCVFPYSEVAKFLQSRYYKEKCNYRVLTDQTVPNSNKSMMYHLYNINGCEVLQLNRFINAIAGDDIRPTTIDLEINDYNLEKIGLFSGKYIISTKELNLLKIFYSNNTSVYLNPYAMPIIFSKQRMSKDVPARNYYILPTKIVQRNVNQIYFLFSSPIQNITISIPYYPGHKLFINKKKLKIHQALAGMYSEILHFKDEELHKTEGILDFSSLTFTIGLFISLLSLVGILVIIKNLI